MVVLGVGLLVVAEAGDDASDLVLGVTKDRLALAGSTGSGILALTTEARDSILALLGETAEARLALVGGVASLRGDLGSLVLSLVGVEDLLDNVAHDK